jgi:hypothetical protein
MRKGLQPFREHAARRPRGARPATEEGNLGTTLSHGSPSRGAGYLRSGRIGPRTHIDIASTILGATDGGLAAPPRTRCHEEQCSPASHLSAACCRPGDDDEGAAWLAACLPSEGGGLSHAVRLERGGREAEANAPARVATPEKRKPGRARIGRSRSCSRVSVVVAEVVRRCSAQRSGRPPFHPIWRPFGDGRLARGTGCESTRATGEETPAPMDKRKPHVTASKPWARPAQGAGGWRWKASRIVRWAYPSRTLIQHGLGKPGFGCPATSGPAGSGSDRGVRGSVASGVHGRRTPRANPGPPAEADRAS